MGPFAAAFKAAFTDCTLTGLPVVTVRSTRGTSGVGTRIAMPSSFPLSSGKTRPMAFAAPGDGGIIDNAAARAAKIGMRQVEKFLIVCVRVDCRHQTALDAQIIV